MANLFQDLNPNNYPAFAFAWLELISHKLFLPYFIKGHVNIQAVNQKLVQDPTLEDDSLNVVDSQKAKRDLEKK